MKKSLEIPSIEQKEIPKEFDRIYVLAHGEPNQPLSMDSKIRILAAMELAKNNKEAEIYFVGGGRPEEGKPTAEQMSDYFERINASSKDQLANSIHSLGRSNNTVANIEEILNSLACESWDKQKSIAIISNAYHADRIKQILGGLDLEMNVLPAENLLQKRSEYHNSFVKKYEASLDYKKKELRDKIMCLYLKIDPDESLIGKLVEKRRKRQIKNQ